MRRQEYSWPKKKKTDEGTQPHDDGHMPLHPAYSHQHGRVSSHHFRPVSTADRTFIIACYHMIAKTVGGVFQKEDLPPARQPSRDSSDMTTIFCHGP